MVKLLFLFLLYFDAAYCDFVKTEVKDFFNNFNTCLYMCPPGILFFPAKSLSQGLKTFFVLSWHRIFSIRLGPPSIKVSRLKI